MHVGRQLLSLYLLSDYRITCEGLLLVSMFLFLVGHLGMLFPVFFFSIMFMYIYVLHNSLTFIWTFIYWHTCFSSEFPWPFRGAKFLINN